MYNDNRIIYSILNLFLLNICLLMIFPQFNYADFDPNEIIPEPNWGVSDSSIAFGDIDNDGDLDIGVTGMYNSQEIFRIYKNNGDGTFDPNEIEPEPGWGVWDGSIAFGDIDNDGDLDVGIIGSGPAGSGLIFRIYKNNGNGTFDPNEIEPRPGWGAYNGSINFGDIDNDGDLDIAVTGTGYTNLTYVLFIHKNNGDGTFDSDRIEPIPGAGYTYSSFAFGDLDNDNDLDIAATGWGAPTSFYFHIYKNNGDGSFNTNKIEPEPGWGIWRSSLALGDIDADGDLDIGVIGNDENYSNQFRIYKNNGDGTFDPNEIEPEPGWGIEYGSIAFGDIDNDGDLDVAVAGDDGDNKIFRIYKNNGNGTFDPNEIIPEPGWGVFYSSIAFGDIDNDGNLDIAVAGLLNAAGKFHIYKNIETKTNNPPSIPVGMTAVKSNGFWFFEWNASIDDNTPINMLHYQIAIGTQPNTYNYASMAIDYPRGQANVGKVMADPDTPYYQTQISIYQKIYWRVCAIDSALKCSSYCAEQITDPELQDIPIDFSKAPLRILPNYIGPDEIKELKIFFKEKNNPTSHYDVRVLTIAGRRMIKDFGSISHEELNKGIKWYLKDDNNNEIPSGMYFVFVTRGNQKYMKKFYFQK